MTTRQKVDKAIASSPVVDLHTHLFAPQFGSLNQWGIDELLTYHYLLAETLRANPAIRAEVLFSREKAAQADLVWQTLFVERSPLSEATAGVLTVLEAFGLDSRAKDLCQARKFFAAQDPSRHLERILELAGVEALAMTNDPADPTERAIWDSGVEPDPRFYAALRIDRMVAETDLAGQMDHWIRRMRPRYLAVSCNEVKPPPTAVFDACRQYDLPLAMMIGVRRGVNFRLGPAGDGMSVVDLEPLERLADQNPEVRFMVTTLARENAHGLCVVARKFANVLPFGCWWFMNNPSLVEETTLMRLEMLGPTFVPQHSDARILEQLVYKWRHARRAIGNALYRRYEAMEVPPSDEQIERDAELLMGGIARGWLG